MSFWKRLAAPLAAAVAIALAGCGANERDGGGGGDADGDSDADTETEYTGPTATIQGVVRAPAGFPISGALVYVTQGDAEAIPDHAYCYECDDMTGKKWTLSGPDGSWAISGVPVGERNLVTRKGFFQRQRQITITGDAVQDVPAEITTLPAESSGDGLDTIPNYAVLLNGWDLPEDMLAKMGLGALTADGNLDTAQPFSFDLYNDLNSSPAAVGESSSLFTAQANLDQYHMIFFPCVCSALTAANYIPMLQQYVSTGGKIYGSCWAGQWVEQPFPELITWNGGDSGTSPGNVGAYNTSGTINDPDMRSWLAVVAPGQNLDSYTFDEGWINIDGLTAGAYEGHGLEEDGYMVVPKVWATDLGNPGYSSAGDPLTVTFNYDCGKLFYSTYQVVEATPSPSIRPQEWVLIYLFFEVGVCEGEYEDPV